MFNMYRLFVVMALVSLVVVPAVVNAGNGEQKARRVVTEIENPEVVYGPILENPVSSFLESFEGTTFPPAGWIKLNPDGGTGWNRQVNGTTPIPGWTGGRITVPPGGGNAVAFCTWNTGGATSNDQWLVTPQVMNVQANDSLKFYLRYWPNSYDDTLEIRISTTTPTIGNFTILVATLGFLGVGTTDTNWNQRGYRLSDYVTPGSNIYIAFRERVADNLNDGASFSLDLVEVTTVVGVDELGNQQPASFALSQNYPNPFNPSTMIKYAIAKPSHVTISVFNLLGNEVARLVDGFRQAGSYEVTWHADGYASGVYFYRMQAGTFSETRKLVILK